MDWWCNTWESCGNSSSILWKFQSLIVTSCGTFKGDLWVTTDMSTWTPSSCDNCKRSRCGGRAAGWVEKWSRNNSKDSNVPFHLCWSLSLATWGSTTVNSQGETDLCIIVKSKKLWFQRECLHLQPRESKCTVGSKVCSSRGDFGKN